MFSATWPKDVRQVRYFINCFLLNQYFQLAADFHTDPVHLTVGSLDLAANHNIEQIVEVVDEYGKNKRLFVLLDEMLAKDVRTINK